MKVLYSCIQVVSNACLLKEINIQTVTKEDIPFSSPFTVTMKRNDYVQVRIVYMSFMYRVSHLVVHLGWVDFDCGCYLSNSAWAVGNLAEAARQLDNMVEHPNQSRPNPGARPDETPCMLLKLLEMVEYQA